MWLVGVAILILNSIRGIFGLGWFNSHETPPKDFDHCQQKRSSYILDICMQEDFTDRVAPTLSILNCYLEEANKKTPECPHQDSNCLSSLTNEQFQTYTALYMHWDTICSQEINKKLLAEIKAMTSNIHTSLTFSQDGKLVASPAGLMSGHALEAVQATGNENRRLLLSILQKVTMIQEHEIYDNTFNLALWYYSIAYTITYAFTIFEKTNPTRVYLFGTLALSFLIEWYISAPGVSESMINAEAITNNLDPEMIINVWTIRQATMLLNILIWTFGLYQYQDKKEANQRILDGISDNMAGIKGQVDQLRNCDDLRISMTPPSTNLCSRSMAINESDFEINSSGESSTWPWSSDNQNDEWEPTNMNSGSPSEIDTEDESKEDFESLDTEVQENLSPRQALRQRPLTMNDYMESESEFRKQIHDHRHLTKIERTRYQTIVTESRQPCQSHGVLFCRACYNFNDDGTIKYED